MQNDLDIATSLSRGQRLTKHVWQHFLEDRCLEEAASLSYTSLLALVPLLAVTFGIVAAFPVFNVWSDQLQQFIFDNMMPAAGEQIVPHLNEFLGSVSGLTLPGTVVLIATALMLMVRIEVAFNRIWRVTQHRSLVNRIVMYWAVLTLGPILIGTALALSAKNILSVIGQTAEFSPALHWLVMFGLSWLVFAMMFLLVPNRRVNVQYAFIGALLSAVLFELAKMAFVTFVSNTNYKVIYGALATIPIFLFWLYLVWIVILFGASLAASLTTFRANTRDGGEWPQRWSLLLAYRVMGHLWQAQRMGDPLSEYDLLEKEKLVSELQLVSLLEQLEIADLARQEHEGGWFLARDIDEFTLADLQLSLRMYLPIGELDSLPQSTAWDLEFVRSLKRIRDESKSTWNRSLRSMYIQQPEGSPE